MSDPIQQFLDMMQAAGTPPANSSDIVADDHHHYIDALGDKKGSKKIKYILRVEDDFGCGGFVNYRHGDWHTFVSKTNGKDYTEEQRKEFKAKAEAARKAKEEERKQEEEAARKEARKVWDVAEYAKPDHPYLVRKKIKPHCFKQHNGKLLVPMWNEARIWAYQTIDEDGEKLYLPGARKRGCWCPLLEKGEAIETFLICEGVATGASIREAVGLPTIIAFDAGNLIHVGEDFRKRYPQSKIIFCADNDKY